MRLPWPYSAWRDWLELLMRISAKYSGSLNPPLAADAAGAEDVAAAEDAVVVAVVAVVDR